MLLDWTGEFDDWLDRLHAVELEDRVRDNKGDVDE
jgi:hypothetical protein